MVNMAEMGGRRAGEKLSCFSATCSRLSQYLKERGGLGDLRLGISAAAAAASPAESRGKPEMLRTMNLLPGVEAVGGDADAPAAGVVAASDRRKETALSMDLFPQRTAFGSSDEKKPDLIRETQRGQMTIFYGGKVVVLDNFPADKAWELMAMAGRGRPTPTPAQCFTADQPEPSPAPPQRPSCPPPAQHNSTIVAALACNSEAKSAAAAAVAPAPTPAVAARETPQKPTQPAASDMPIARRASLHRFLEKRKERISAKAPYPVSSSPAGTPASASPAKPQENRQWLGLAPRASEDLYG